MEYTLQGNYGGSAKWEDLTSEDTLEEIKERLGDYLIDSHYGSDGRSAKFRVGDENGNPVDMGV